MSDENFQDTNFETPADKIILEMIFIFCVKCHCKQIWFLQFSN